MTFVASCVRLYLRSLPSTGITRFVGCPDLSATPHGPTCLSRAASGSDCDHRRVQVCVWSPLPTCHRHYPGSSGGELGSLVRPPRQRPSLCNSQSGSCKLLFRDLLSVHSPHGLHARGVA